MHTHTHTSLCWKFSWLPELLLAASPVFRDNPLIAACVLGAGLLLSPLGVRVCLSGSLLTALPSFPALILHTAPQPWESAELKLPSGLQCSSLAGVPQAQLAAWPPLQARVKPCALLFRAAGLFWGLPRVLNDPPFFVVAPLRAILLLDVEDPGAGCVLPSA